MQNFQTKLLFLGLLGLFAFGCQNQTASNSANQTNSNISANNANDPSSSNSVVSELMGPQVVKFESAGKVEIVGTFYQSQVDDATAVLLLHQFGDSRKSYEKFARDLQMKGFNILAIDGRGFGDSTKTTDGKTVAAERTADGVKAMKADVAGAFEFLAKQKNVDANRMGIVGASYGSSLAIIYAAENPKVKAVALLSPGINYFDNLPTEPAIKSYGNRHLLFVAAEDDKESAYAVRKLKSENPNDKYETKIYEKGGHGTALFAVGLQDLLEEFLKKNL
jgi:dienelactone hydrolase